jgi:hypothetical protein
MSSTSNLIPTGTRGRRAAAVVAATMAAAAAVSMGAGPAEAKGGGAKVERSGTCAASSHWKLSTKLDDGRLEVEGEVDSNHAGQVWAWRLLHNGTTAASGTRTTVAPSGSFEVSRSVPNASGTDTLTLRARNKANGELCVGTLRF